ncbi:uncharacterized protein F5891DRAFT_1194652 [Suillus fuscotomentosus]|uniref:CxC2-like cysteine cluster KDZ transposase-associated domain-containing protein n=1 Tax=Suillus fuscotomentosus TaxID=1912939 RepID=A0AAD4HFV4_9AGAM|nr:uncharacterized protein F5891DRAFT_1194652 [Suillus fuscotomentosus]KAG1894987.1 hypothetical protein F5891DRAFT_1194652 [Suillus fuscotomentosus]
MGKSTVREWTPQKSIRVVVWKGKPTNRGDKGRWVDMACNQRARQNQQSPSKSTSRQSQRMLYNDGDAQHDIGDMAVSPPALPKSLSQNDYLRQWQLRTEEYLMLLLEREAPPVGRAWKPLYCSNCCRTEHRRLPFHKISQWNGTYFEESSLTKAGLEFYLGHGGEPCPSDLDILNGDVFDWIETDDYIDPDDIPPETVTTWVSDKKATTIVDKTGVHSLILRYCQCHNSLSPDRQLFQMGMFPATFTHLKTAFTFSGLDNYLLDNLECGTSAMNHFSKLRRMTSSVFPHIVPDRYRELMRVSRQWRQLKCLKRNGFGHEARKPKPGELALFCPACPQPGINMTLPDADTADRDPNANWLYTWSLVMDGNFKAKHLHMANPNNEVWLMDGHGFMVGKDRYKLHLDQAKDHLE